MLLASDPTMSSTTAAAALQLVRSNQRVFVHGGVATPSTLLRALAARAGELRNVELIHLHTEGAAPCAAPDLAGSFFTNALFLGANVRDAVAHGNADYIPAFLSEMPALFRQGILPLDVALVHVSPPDAHGYCSLGTSVDIARAAVDTATLVIAQVNPRMPRTHGDGLVHMRRFAATVAVDEPLPEHPHGEIGDVEQAIGRHVASLIEDGSTLQMGIGALPDAVCAALHDHRDLGIHTEMLTPGLVELMKAGVVTNARKTLHPGKTVFTFSMGNRSTYEFLHENPAFEARPVDYVNDPAVIARNAKMISVNATLQIDLFGACCSEYLNGRQYTASGGQLDFVRGAAASEGGKSIIACHSTAAKGTASRIVARLDGPATTPRNDIHYVVTEHGAVNLKGLTDDARARALISLAAPEFREGLEREAKAMGLL